MAKQAKGQRVDRRNFIRLGSASVVGTTALFAGCIGSDDDDDDTSNGGGDNDDTSNGEMATNGELTIGIDADPRGLNPHGPMDFASGYIARHYADTLYDFTPDGEPFPRLAAEMPETPDDQTYIVKIREGVTWHEPYDAEITADDIVENFHRILDIDYGAESRADYEGTLVGDDINPEDTVQKTGDYEVTFNLASPDSVFVHHLTGARSSMLPMEAVDEYGSTEFGATNVGTWGSGPFRFVDAQDDNYYTFERNPNYFLEDDGGQQLPYLDTVTFEVIPEASVRNTNIQTGDIDVDERVSGTDIEGLQEDDSIVVQSEPGTEMVAMPLNIRNFEPFTKKEVRQALMHAINRDAIVDTNFRGHAEPAWSSMPPWLWAHDDDAVQTYPHDPDRARSLLEEAGETGLEFTLNPANVDMVLDTATIIQSNLEEVGISMDIEPRDSGALFDELLMLWDEDPVGPDEDFHAGLMTLTFGYDPDFNSRITHGTGSWGNFFYYSNEVADEAAENARQVVDQDERAEYYSQFLEQVTEDVPLCYVVWMNITPAHRDNVNNYTVWNDGRVDVARTGIESDN
ncbi:ABC transporter substrate-binding protein [Natrialbaceae archaeon A-CW1-1]